MKTVTKKPLRTMPTAEVIGRVGVTRPPAPAPLPRQVLPAPAPRKAPMPAPIRSAPQQAPRAPVTKAPMPLQAPPATVTSRVPARAPNTKRPVVKEVITLTIADVCKAAESMADMFDTLSQSEWLVLDGTKEHTIPADGDVTTQGCWFSVIHDPDTNEVSLNLSQVGRHFAHTKDGNGRICERRLTIVQ